MSVRCPVCHLRIPLLRLRGTMVCEECRTTLRGHFMPPLLTFLCLSAITNGFLILVWWLLSQAGPATDTVNYGQTNWQGFPLLLFLLDIALTWGLFVWIFRTLAHVSATGAPRGPRRRSPDHFQPRTPDKPPIHSASSE